MNYSKNLKSFHKGFTLMEMMISMVVITILLAASMPLITQFSSIKTGIDKNVMKCITSNNSTGWYDVDSNGSTGLPTAEPCRGAVLDTIYNRGNSYNTSEWFAKAGTSTQQVMAKKILRTACDEGGSKACDFFINLCRKSGGASVPYCDNTSSFSDITYYLSLPSATNTNSGATYIANQLEGLLPKMLTNLVNEAFYDCDTYPNSIACDVARPEVYIKACNNGFSEACTVAYDPDPINHLITPYNRSCNQIKAVWNSAPTGTYRLTYNGAENPVSVNCTMGSMPSAAITGCNASPYVPDDCTYAYNHHYNRSCSDIVTTWVQAPAGTYNLTSSGAPPTAPVVTTCPAVNINCTNTIGSTCPDGTKYAGDYGGYHLFVMPQDAYDPANTPTFNTFSWNNGSTGMDFLGATNPDNGLGNYNTILAATNSETPYRAAMACDSLNHSANNYGHTDWYLPAINEIKYTLDLNRVILGIYTGNGYVLWTSTEISSNNACGWWVRDVSGYAGGAGKAYYSTSVRCIRYETSPNACASLGVTGTPCTTDPVGAKYAGYYDNRYFFTTPSNEIGNYYWNNGVGGLVSTGATSTTEGVSNTNILNNLSNSESPYKAAKFCGDMNAGSFTNYGHTDWYLPARYEMDVLRTNRSVLGITQSFYWASNEEASLKAQYLYMGSAETGGRFKFETYGVRCIRREHL